MVLLSSTFMSLVGLSSTVLTSAALVLGTTETDPYLGIRANVNDPFLNETVPEGTRGFVVNGTIGSYPCFVKAGLYGKPSSEEVNSASYSECIDDALEPTYPFNKIHLRSPDDSIRATFIPFGARLTEMWVKDRNQDWQDITLGFDNTTNYGTEPVHPYFGPVVGRYANRIKNGTFEVGGQTYHTPLNENDIDTLHGGTDGFDRRSWKIEHLNASSITFTLHDPAGNQGFPHEVNVTAIYTLQNDATWDARMYAKSSGKTPVMLSAHNYWNLDPQGLVNLTASDRPVLDYVLHLPYANNYIAGDTILIPTGEVPSVSGTGLDFTSPTPFSQNFNQTKGICGLGCTGWDTCWVMKDGHPENKPVLTMSSPASGIQLAMYTNQAAIQVYTSSGLANPANGLIPRKRVHGGQAENLEGAEDGVAKKYYENYSAVVIEAEDWIDGINNPQWGRKEYQVLNENETYDWHATYVFSTV
jgi:aldose 1-epimerase